MAGLDTQLISALAETSYGEGTEARHEAVFALLVDVAETYAKELMRHDPNVGRAEAVMVTVAGLRENLEDMSPVPAPPSDPVREAARADGWRV